MTKGITDSLHGYLHFVCGLNIHDSRIAASDIVEHFGIDFDGNKCNLDKCPDDCDKEPSSEYVDGECCNPDKEPSEENPVVRHDNNEISIKDGDRLFSRHVLDALKHVNSDDEESLEFIHNSITMAARILIDAPLRRHYESSK